jgi:formylglycine-generating enzyme required for sulfatase activity
MQQVVDDSFEYDVFLSYSHKDESIIHHLARRLKQDGLQVWLDEWVIEPGDLIPLKIQQGLEKSHTLLMCMSPAYFESEWGKMEHYTLLFRDPTNTQRRLIPLLIADCTRPDTISQFKFIDWRTSSNEAYDKILTSCQKKNPELSSTNPNSGVKLNIPKTFTSLSTGMEFILIPAGKFMMGSPSYEKNRFDDEEPAHEVIIQNSFYLGKYSVTQKQWLKVMEKNPSYFNGKDLPVECISWNDVQVFIKKLNEEEGTDKYRLPSESEWEYACRAGTITRYSFGDDESQLNDYAWYGESLDSGTHPVGQKKPNSWGIFDMHGNVWEWCQDTYHDNYNGTPSDGSPWENGISSIRVARGGSWSRNAVFCRSASRIDYNTFYQRGSLGFRVVREIEASNQPVQNTESYKPPEKTDIIKTYITESQCVNEFNEDIPEDVAKKALELGCKNIKYVYKDGEYHGKYPAASIGGSKATRFRNTSSAEAHKINLGKGWVVFRSPSKS